MEEIQKKTRKVTKSDKNDEAPKVEAVTKKPRTRAAASTKKEAKASKPETAKKETKTEKTKTVSKASKTGTKSTKTETTKTTAKSPKTETVKTTTKKATTKKETDTPKANTTKKVTRVSKTKSIEEPIVEKIPNREEPKLTIIHEKKEQPIQESEDIQKKQTQKVNNSAQKKQPKQVKNTETKKEKKDKKAKKNYIDISVGAIICAVIIIGLIILNVKLGTRAYNVITGNDTTASNVETDNNISVTQEVGNVLSNSDELVAEMKEKITFAPNVTASIYDAETFSTNTISNDLKLRLGWAKTEEGNKLKSKNENREEVEAIEKETMAENIKNILGPNVKYKDESFNNTDISTFSAYCKNQGTISYSNGIYTSIVSEDIENEMAPLIYQEIQKVVKYTDKVVIYVKVAYMDVEGDNYIVYKDFSNEEFEEKLLEITSEELFREESSNQYTGIVTTNANTALDDIRSQLDTYKYTFSLDEETEEYYLTKFNKALSMQ